MKNIRNISTAPATDYENFLTALIKSGDTFKITSAPRGQQIITADGEQTEDPEELDSRARFYFDHDGNYLGIEIE